MTVYVDTSALYALVISDDPAHVRAREAMRELQSHNASLVTSSYVLLETAALLQARVGVDAARTLHERMRPVLHVIWVDEALHDLAMAALLVADRRGLSLVDWVGFTVMRQHGITEAFAFDDDFADQGFTLVPMT